MILASRHVHGIREDVDERAFFPEASGTARNYTDSYQPLSMSSYKSYSNSSFQNINDATNQRQQEQQHCFVLGTDFKSTRPSKEKEAETTSQRPLHRFFGEWPPKNTDSWLDLASNSRIPTGNNEQWSCCFPTLIIIPFLIFHFMLTYKIICTYVVSFILGRWMMFFLLLLWAGGYGQERERLVDKDQFFVAGVIFFYKRCDVIVLSGGPHQDLCLCFARYLYMLLSSPWRKVKKKKKHVSDLHTMLFDWKAY